MTYIKQITIIFSVILSVNLSLTMYAQNIDSLRLEKDRATETFFDKSNSKGVRLSALKNMSYPEDETFSRLIILGKDNSEDKDVRLAAIKTHRYDEAYFNAVMDILSNSSEPESLVVGLIENIGQRTTFRMPSEMRQKLQSTLRSRIDDPSENIRLAAYRILVSSHDIVAIDKLVESLRSGVDIPIPLADGIELLDVDGSSKHLVTLRPYLNHPDPKVQAQAARALAVDPESRDSVVEIAINNEGSTVTRKNALRGLSREDQKFMQYATNLMLDTEESSDIRYEAMKNAMGRLNYQNEPASVQIEFAQAVERIALGRPGKTSDGKELTSEAKQLLAHLQKTFPAIGRFYKFRK